MKAPPYLLLKILFNTNSIFICYTQNGVPHVYKRKVWEKKEYRLVLQIFFLCIGWLVEEIISF